MTTKTRDVRSTKIHNNISLFFFFEREREFQLMASAHDDSSLSSDQNTNQFLV